MSRAEDAWQGALAAEQRAAFGYGLLGPRLAGDKRSLAVMCSDAHESLRDATSAAIVTAGLTPAAPHVDYPDLYPVDGPRSAGTAAARIEDDCAAAWRYLYSQAASDARSGARLRAEAQRALTASAVRAVRWRRMIDPAHAAVAFPGIPSS